MELERLKELYEKYEKAYEEVLKKASPIDGLFGIGEDPRKDPCHMCFYEGVEQWVTGFLADSPDRERAYQASYWILSAAAEYAGEPVYWFMFAAHEHCRKLIPLLSQAQCAELRKLYDDRYPRRERMPLQKQIYDLLCKGDERR